MKSSKALVIVILAFMLLVACWAVSLRVLEHIFDRAPASPRRVERASERKTFDVARIVQHVEHLAYGIGPRRPGSEELNRAADYVSKIMGEAGYVPVENSFDLPDGGKGQNVVADKEGKRSEVLILAAHLDTVKGCPGANDDASGVGAILEIAWALQNAEPPSGLRFLFLGAEEAIPGSFDAHGFSSMNYLASLSEKQKQAIVGCIVLDKIGFGPDFAILHIAESDRSQAERCQRAAQAIGHPTDISTVKRWNAHMPFEDAGISTAWIEWRPDPNLHKPSDVPNNLDEEKIEVAVRMVLEAIRTGHMNAQ